MPFQAKKNGGTSGEKSGGFLSTVRSISDMGRSLSHGRNLGKIEEETKGGSAVNLELPKVDITMFKEKCSLKNANKMMTRIRIFRWNPCRKICRKRILRRMSRKGISISWRNCLPGSKPAMFLLERLEFVSTLNDDFPVLFNFLKEYIFHKKKHVDFMTIFWSDEKLKEEEKKNTLF